MIVRRKAKSLRQIRRELAALQPGQTWCADYPITISEFIRITPAETRAELFNGVIYMPQPSDEHEAIFVFLITLLYGYASACDLGEVRGSRSGVELDLYSAPQPDILFVRKDRRGIIRRLGITGAPDLIIEIVSSEASRSRALAKLLRYEAFGVRELWYIDIERQVVRVTNMVRRGRYGVSFDSNKGTVTSKVIPGFAIEAEWLWAKNGKLPSAVPILNRLLAKSSK